MNRETRRRNAVRSQCTGKVRYRDRAEANRVKHKRSAFIDHGLRVYDCPFCNGCHLTKEAEYGAGGGLEKRHRHFIEG